MFKKNILTSLFVASAIAVVASCDSDFNDVGSDLINNANFLVKDTSFSVVAFNQELNPVQTNGFTMTPFGVYSDPAFGTTEFSFVSQVELSDLTATIPADATIVDAKLQVPYFSTLKSTAEDGSHTYELDSIYGGANKFKLSVYESGYFMNDLDVASGLQLGASYFSNQFNDFETNIRSSRLNDSIASQNDDFFFSDKEFVAVTKTTTNGTETETKTYTKPEMRLSLNKSFFENKILKAPAAALANQSEFKRHFRGLYFKVEQAASPGAMMMMNFKDAKITVRYRQNETTTTNGTSTTTRVLKSITLKLGGNNVVLQNKRSSNPVYSQAISSANQASGDDKIFVKGMEGSMGVIKLFDTPGQLAALKELFKNKNYAINQARLIVNVDSAAIGKSTVEPQRLILYNADKGIELYDYKYDGSTSNISTKLNKQLFGGILEKDATTKRGLRYVFNITGHVNNILKNDSTNVKIGLSVAEDINNSAFKYFKTPIASPLNFTKMPATSILSPQGTVLFGGTNAVDEKKRLKLEIYYTKKR